ncbi:PREDICTED: solute carrier organic anion transporter family member 1A5-like [Atta colombica]|uniref:solute carrier organic anion transporter family member 1A5-like n=1 Tax=Atta colombica TaxID=520822 RepID=UPI00084C5B67|nr:PREDICTED: solute carrier organic anion transporter family member 1A5-like [Atta colombica]
MTVRFPEVIRSRSEVEGGLAGPANPIPSQSIDCGCGQMQFPKLAKFATRKLFVGLICWIGVVQAASYAYFHVTGSTIARRFQIDPYIMDWILVTAELTPIVLGLAIAYWGDKIHRASWIGAVTLLQSVAHFVLIIPHLTHRVRVIEETQNVTHMSLYADDSPELCTPEISRIISEEEPCYITMIIIILVLIVSGMSSITYYALGISYLDDNTKKKHVTGFIGVIIAVKIAGIVLGYLLGWGCLRIDAEDFSVVNSYRNQIGAWWLGFPILSILLVIPGLLLSWFPRRLPSEVVEQAAASLLDRTTIRNRAPHRTTSQKVGNPNFWPSLCRLFTNRILICNILATAFSAMALLNFMTLENIFLESRFHIPRPTGMLRGFDDPLPSRLVTNIGRPILIGLVIIISGLVLTKAKPRARFIIGYSFIIVLLTIAIIIGLIFATCDKSPVVNLEKSSNTLLRYCNKDCRCSKDADFRPICDNSGKFTYYNPCYAGCSTIIYVDDVKIYSGCNCVEEMTGWGNDQAKDGPCDSSKCQVGWMVFEFGSLLAYTLIASTFVGDILVNIRSVYKQDKAISIGFWMMWVAVFVYIPGKILYEFVSNQMCQYWGSQKIICHFHNSEKLEDYLCYLTILFLSLCVLLKIIVWFFCKNLQLYEEVETKDQENTELQEMFESAIITELLETSNNNNDEMREVEAIVEPELAESRTAPETTFQTKPEENSAKKKEDIQKSAPMKLNGMTIPYNRRPDSNPPTNHNSQSSIRNLSDDELDSSSDESKKRSNTQVAYTPLELDSDVESDLGSVGPRSRKRISSKDCDQTQDEKDHPSSRKSSLKRQFPNPDHYEDPRRSRNSRFKNPIGYQDDSSKTNSSEFAKKGQESEVPKQGNFNEVGVPIVVDQFPDRKGNLDSTNTAHLSDVKSLIDRYEQNASQETLNEDRLSEKSTEDMRSRPESKIGIPLVAMVPHRSSSRGQSSSGSSSLPDIQNKNSDPHSERLETPSPKNVTKDSKVSRQTDL